MSLKSVFIVMSAVTASNVPTKVFAGQKPGTSGLRKKVEEFMQEHYMENFIQCTLEAMGPSLAGSTLVVGGDGRYGVDQAVDLIIKMAAANKVRSTSKLQDHVRFRMRNIFCSLFRYQS